MNHNHSSIPDIPLFPYGKQRIERSRGIRRIILKSFPLHFLSALRQELHFFIVRTRFWPSGKRPKTGGNALINLGCGDTGLPDWYNIDGHPGKRINLVFDIRKRIPLPDACAKGIFCEHFLEHLEYSEEVPFFIAECFRILQPGGVLRLIVPDAEKYLHAYCHGGWDELTTIRPLKENHQDFWFGDRFSTRMELINLVFRQGGEHRFAYDSETLESVLYKFSFSKIERCEYGQGALPDILLDRQDRASESLYMEALK